MQEITVTLPRLSPREKEVLMCIADGYCSKQIADILHISKLTVGNHRSKMIRKFGVKNTCELIRKFLN